MPTHIALDQAEEAKLGKKVYRYHGKEVLGLAMRIKYQEKVGLRFQDLKNIDLFTKNLSNLMDYHNFLLEEYYKVKKIDKSQVSDEIINKYQQIKTYIIDTDEYINDL